MDQLIKKDYAMKPNINQKKENLTAWSDKMNEGEQNRFEHIKECFENDKDDEAQKSFEFALKQAKQEVFDAIEKNGFGVVKGICQITPSQNKSD